LGAPDNLKVPFSANASVRNAEPDKVWQSVQWQIVTVRGSISAVYVTSPQWQPPSIFMWEIAPHAVTADRSNGALKNICTR
jgi:hypothetical protein